MTGRLVLRIPIRVTTFDNKNGKVLNVSTYTKQTQLLQFVQSQVKLNGNSDVTFTAKVLYNRKEDYFNEFDFKTVAEFNRKIEPCLERDLLKELVKNKVLLKEYVTGL